MTLYDAVGAVCRACAVAGCFKIALVGHVVMALPEALRSDPIRQSLHPGIMLLSTSIVYFFFNSISCLRLFVNVMKINYLKTPY